MHPSLRSIYANNVTILQVFMVDILESHGGVGLELIFFQCFCEGGSATSLTRLAGSEDCFSPVVSCLRSHSEICLSVNI